MRLRSVMGTAVLALALAGCDSAPRGAQPLAKEGPIAASLPVPVFDELDADGLRTRAENALRAQRIHAPAGDCAVDYYLALRERSREASGVAAALTELQPYVLIAAEQALARGDLEEGRRLLVLLSRMDADAPSLPRLRESLRLAQERADRDEGARPESPARIAERALAPPVIAPARPVASPSTTPATSPAMAVAEPPAAMTTSPVASPRMDDATASVPTTRVVREDASVPLPRLLADATPRYPPLARNRRIEGSVRLAFTIQPDGSVGDVQPVSAQPAGVFEDAALAAAARWRFEATGRSVRTSRTLTFRLPLDAKG